MPLPETTLHSDHEVDEKSGEPVAPDHSFVHMTLGLSVAIGHHPTFGRRRCKSWERPNCVDLISFADDKTPGQKGPLILTSTGLSPLPDTKAGRALLFDPGNR